MSGRFRMFQVMLGVGMLVQLLGFIYDITWHNSHPSATPAGPLTLLHIHSGIYLSLLISLPTCVLTLMRSAVSKSSRIGLWVSLAGGIVGVVGNVTDIWAHGHGYEKDIYHYLMYAGAGIMLLGYSVVELARIGETGAGSGEPVAADRPERVRQGD